MPSESTSAKVSSADPSSRAWRRWGRRMAIALLLAAVWIGLTALPALGTLSD